MAVYKNYTSGESARGPLSKILKAHEASKTRPKVNWFSSLKLYASSEIFHLEKEKKTI